ncbi:MAG: baseplate J/gp47 family protein [Negativicutes bacterium]|nr:baseplate J/gp47 family protein [Negativicutes bacterium]
MASIDFRSLIGAKAFSDLVDQARQQLATKASQITNWNVGGIFRTLTELAMQGLSDLYDLLVSIVPMGYVQYATGTWLRLKVAEIGIEALLAQKTQGNVTFGRNQVGLAIPIPSGSIVKTDLSSLGDELRYFTTADMILPANALEIQVPVLAEFEGSKYNVGQGYIKNLVTHIDGIDSISNSPDWVVSEGADEEDDDSIRSRYYLKWNELATGSIALAYVSWAKSVAGVMDVAVNDRHPRGQGTVDVVITSTNGLPTQTLIDSVTAYIDTKRPNCSDVLVKAPQPISIDFDITLYLPATEGDTTAAESEGLAIIDALFVKDNVRTYITPYKIGETPYRAKLDSFFMGIASVVNVDINSPATDIPIAADQIAARGNITVNAVRLA